MIHFTEAASVMTHRIGIRLYNTDERQKGIHNASETINIRQRVTLSSFGLNLEKILVLAHLWNILYSCLEPAESTLSFGGFGYFCLLGVFCVREVVPNWKTRHRLLGMLLVLVKDLLAYLWLSMKVLCAELIIIACHTILCFMWKYKNIDVQIQLNFWLRENPINFFFSGLECFCHSHGLEFTLCKIFW